MGFILNFSALTTSSRGYKTLMANIFGILTTVVLLITVLVAMKNKSRYEAEIEEVIVQKNHLRVSQERLAASRKKLADINAEIPVVEARTQELVEQTEQQRATNSTLESQLQAKTSESGRNRDRINQLQSQISAFGNLDQLMVRLRNLQTELQELNDPDDGNPGRKLQLEQLSERAIRIDGENVVANSILDGYVRGESKPGMTTRIRSIYPNWGFVTLAAGGIAGVAGNSTMDVIRDNQIIAKLQVTAVEPNSATATIVPGSLLDEVVLSVGDTVVPGTRVDVD